MFWVLVADVVEQKVVGKLERQRKSDVQNRQYSDDDGEFSSKEKGVAWPVWGDKTWRNKEVQTRVGHSGKLHEKY